MTDDQQVDSQMDLGSMNDEYVRYLNEVGQVLKEDVTFIQLFIHKATNQQLIDGSVAEMIQQVAPNIRSRLDELKRIELDRLRKLALKKHKLEEDDIRRWRTIDAESNHVPRIDLLDVSNLNHRNYHTFEKEDLQRLITHASQNLKKLDKKRRR